MTTAMPSCASSYVCAWMNDSGTHYYTSDVQNLVLLVLVHALHICIHACMSSASISAVDQQSIHAFACIFMHLHACMHAYIVDVRKMKLLCFHCVCVACRERTKTNQTNNGRTLIRRRKEVWSGAVKSGSRPNTTTVHVKRFCYTVISPPHNRTNFGPYKLILSPS